MNKIVLSIYLRCNFKSARHYDSRISHTESSILISCTNKTNQLPKKYYLSAYNVYVIYLLSENLYVVR